MVALNPCARFYVAILPLKNGISLDRSTHATPALPGIFFEFFCYFIDPRFFFFGSFCSTLFTIDHLIIRAEITVIIVIILIEIHRRFFSHTCPHTYVHAYIRTYIHNR